MIELLEAVWRRLHAKHRQTVPPLESRRYALLQALQGLAFLTDGVGSMPHRVGCQGHSTSELLDALLEVGIEDMLHSAGISYRKTKRAERVPGFDQAPDFIVPDEFNPRVVIEAKITEDDGTARDKITRVRHLVELSRAGMPEGKFKYEVIACIGGRGFGIRREDMRNLLLATHGKVFTLGHLHRLVECSMLREFRTK